MSVENLLSEPKERLEQVLRWGQRWLGAVFGWAKRRLAAFFGWGAIFGMFVYFFALVVVLYEIHGFHRLVAHYLDDDLMRSREVLLAVREAGQGVAVEQPADHAHAFREARIAYSLEELRTAQSALNGLESGNFTLQETPPPAVLFSRHVRALDEALLELDQLLLERHPDLALHAKLGVIGTALERLHRIELTQTTLPAAGESGSARLDNGPARRLEDMLPVQIWLDASDARARGGTSALDPDKIATDEASLEARAMLEGAWKLAGEQLDELRGVLALEAADEVISTRLAELEHAFAELEAIKTGQEIDDRWRVVAGTIGPGGDEDIDVATVFGAALVRADQAIASLVRVTAGRSEASLQAAQLAAAMGELDAASAAFGRLNVSAEAASSGSGADVETVLAAARTDLQGSLARLEAMIATGRPQDIVAETLSDSERPQAAANAVWTYYRSLDRYEHVLKPLTNIQWAGVPVVGPSLQSISETIGFRPSDLAIWSDQSLTLMLVFVMGAIGSLIFITKYQLELLLQGTKTKGWRPVRWYVFRPIFGIVVAFAIYLLYRSGQLALGAGNAEMIGSEVNIWILSVLSLFAGLLSWDALEMIESRGNNWLSSYKRKALWATGLDNALEQGKHSIAECANQIGVSEGQVRRWIDFRDRVTPEMQDRVATWLDRPRVELFGDVPPRPRENGNKHRLKAVLFDLDETLFDRTRSLRAFLADQYSKHEVLQKWAEQAFIERFLELDRRGLASKAVVYTTIVDELESDDPGLAARLELEYEHVFRRFADPFPGLNALIDEMRRRGLAFGIVTNGRTAMQTSKIEALGLQDRFDPILISEAEGVRKPDAEIFLRATQRLELLPEQCLFVGDSPLADIQGARKVGMRTVWFSNGAVWPEGMANEADYTIKGLPELVKIIDGLTS